MAKYSFEFKKRLLMLIYMEKVDINIFHLSMVLLEETSKNGSAIIKILVMRG